MSDTAVERDEGLIEQLVHVHDICRREGVNPAPVMPQVEDAIRAVRSLRDAEDAAGMTRKERTTIGSALGDITKHVQVG